LPSKYRGHEFDPLYHRLKEGKKEREGSFEGKKERRKEGRKEI
jgi:hypothetical protein